ncbi:hypothetical protein [Fimbriiglobus ruber]|uniref:Uncharacterized protein n=1 Tax=Fimbriiglobus ruber TaxID=1908690 RepID=A0A225D3P0_9BACT|nr:hypothetical protein [Fimbriiglobus ruber]OWK34244.1 hypothetical protein FRUB_10215 [Fimbriiglobus ruber]
MTTATKREASLGITLRTWRLYDVARRCVFNESGGALEIGGIAVGYDDTEGQYAIVLSRKDGKRPTKGDVSWAKVFINGVAAAFQTL